MKTSIHSDVWLFWVKPGLFKANIAIFHAILLRNFFRMEITLRLKIGTEAKLLFASTCKNTTEKQLYQVK